MERNKGKRRGGKRWVRKEIMGKKGNRNKRRKRAGGGEDEVEKKEKFGRREIGMERDGKSYERRKGKGRKDD